ARIGLLARGAERVPAGHVLEHDAAPALTEALREQFERRLDARLVVVGDEGQIGHAERRGGDDEHRLDRPRKRLERAGRDQAERAVLHAELLSLSGRETLIGANGAAWSMRTSFPLASSRSARNAAACSRRDSPSTSASSMNAFRRRRVARKRSRKRSIGGKRRPMCASDSGGGSARSTLIAAARSSGRPGARRRSGRGASGAGPTRK